MLTHWHSALRTTPKSGEDKVEDEDAGDDGLLLGGALGGPESREEGGEEEVRSKEVISKSRQPRQLGEYWSRGL